MLFRSEAVDILEAARGDAERVRADIIARAETEAKLDPMLRALVRP